VTLREGNGGVSVNAIGFNYGHKKLSFNPSLSYSQYYEIKKGPIMEPALYASTDPILTINLREFEVVGNGIRLINRSSGWVNPWSAQSFGPSELRGYYAGGGEYFQSIDPNTGNVQTTFAHYFANPKYHTPGSPREIKVIGPKVTYVVPGSFPEETFPGNTKLLYEYPSRVAILEIDKVSSMRFESNYAYFRLAGHRQGQSQPQTHWIYYKHPIR
jgi:hypothetical protein